MEGNKHGNMRCVQCHGFDLDLHVGWDGMDEESMAGEFSGFNALVSLVCNTCGRAYPVCRVRDFSDVSELVEVK